MRRREFIAGLVGAAWPLLVLAQQSDRVRRIGVLSSFAEDDAQAQARVAALRQGMRERGWNEGRNLQIDFCWAGPDAGRIKSCAEELISLAPDATLGMGSASIAALKQATRAIPIVFAAIGDPVGQGLSRAWRGRAATLRALPGWSSRLEKSGSSFSNRLLQT